MKYFTREQHDALNSDDRAINRAYHENFERNRKLYFQQLEKLKPRLSAKAWIYFSKVGLHDGTLLSLQVGDDIYRRFPTYRTGLVNRRRVSVRVEALNWEETRLYTFTYRDLRRVVFDYPSGEPWLQRLSNPIDHWMEDELTAADADYLKHEVLFTSGTTLSIEFRRLSLRWMRVSGRSRFPS